MTDTNQTSDCPQDQDLLLILSGDCNPTLQVDTEAHLAKCDECVKRLEELSFRDADYIAKHFNRELTAGRPFTDTESKLADTIPVAEKPESAKTASDETVAIPHLPGYEIHEPIARGGMGIVYRAQELELQREVAIKMILGGLMAGPERIHRFAQEATALAQLDHPNIVKIYHVEATHGQPYFVMEFIEGPSLQDQLDGTPWQPERAAKLVKQLADAISSAHEREIVHRDLKPANILMDRRKPRSDYPRIIDFGLAKNVGGAEYTKTGEVFGSPSYMSPEQTTGAVEQLGAATDIYSLGCILYELLTGRPPFKGATIPATLQQIVNDDPVRPRLLNSGIPKDLETIGLKCIEKDIEKRYSNAAELAADLSNFLAKRPITARPASLIERSWKLARRHPAWATTAVVLLFASLGVLGIWAKFTADLATQTQIALNQKKLAQKQAALAHKNAQLANHNEQLAKQNEEQAIRNFKRAETEIEIQEHTYLFTTTLISKLKKLNQNDELVKIVLDSEREFDDELQDEPLMKAAYLRAMATTLSEIAAPQLALDKIDQAIQLFQDLDPDSVQYSHALIVKMMILYQLDSIVQVRQVRNQLKNDELTIHEKDLRLLDFIDAQLFVMEHKYQEAGIALQRFLDLDDSDFGNARQYRGHALGLMGIVKIRLNQIDEALDYLGRHLEMVEQSNGRDSDVFLRAQNRLAFALMKAGKHDDAVALFELALADCLERFGEENFTTLEVMINAARACQFANQHESAFQLNQRAAIASLKKYGPRHQFTMTALCQIAANAFDSESQADALSFLIEQVDQEELKIQSDYLSVSLIALMARLFFDTNDYEKSREFTRIAGKRVRSANFKSLDQNILKSIEKLERELATIQPQKAVE